MYLDREQIAWAAGVFEGEGSARKRMGYGQAMQLVMTDEDIIRRFNDAVKVGYVNGPYGPYQPQQTKPQWHWAACKFEEAQAVAAMLWPWLGPRRKNQIRDMLGRGQQ